jgi:hypothetical protein
MIISVHSESLCETGCKSSFTGSHFTDEHDEVAWTNNTGYCTGNGVGITEIRSTKLNHE